MLRRAWGAVGRWGGLGLLAAWSAQAQHNAFTYQGRLLSGNRPAQGLFDFELRLLLPEAGPADPPLAEVVIEKVAVAEGLFTVPVEFPAHLFDGDPRSIEVGVRSSDVSGESLAGVGLPGGARGGGVAGLAGAGPAPFSRLSPRLTVAPVPYAFYARRAGSAVSAGTAAGVSPGSLTPASLAAIAPGQSGVLGIAGGSFTVQPGLGAGAWLLAGNGATVSGNFLGTTDPRPLELRVQNERALLLSPAAGSPNLIGGHAANEVTNTSIGVAIGGGGSAGIGANRAGADFVVIDGGRSNAANGLAAVVGGGQGNTASGGFATVSGGSLNQGSGYAAVVSGGGGVDPASGVPVGNQALGPWSQVAGGRENVAGGASAAVAGGQNNQAHLDAATVGGGTGNLAQGTGATVGGGGYNQASLNFATVSGGHENVAQADSATVGGGVGNHALGPAGTIGGGANNMVTGTNAFVPGGHKAHAAQYGQMAHAGGNFQTEGDAQGSVYILRNRTDLSAPSALLFLDGTAVPLRILPGRTVAFDLLVVARKDNAAPNPDASAAYACRGVVRHSGGVAQFVGGPPFVTALGEDDPQWDAQVMLVGDALAISVTSGGANPVPHIRWVARVEAAEVAW